MLLQETISREKLKQKTGRTFQVLLDEVTRQGALGRSFSDAPEIDGVVHVKRPRGVKRQLRTGEFVTVKITKTDAHDMWGEVVVP